MNAILHRKVSRILIPSVALVGFWSAYASQAQEIEFDIDAQPTDQTLLDIAEAGDVQVLFSPDVVERNESPEVRGAQSLESALETSLDATGLVYEFKSEDFIVVKHPEKGVVRLASATEPGQESRVLLAQLQTSESQQVESLESLQSSERESRSDAEDPVAEVEEVVVTGTRLRNSSPSSPVDIYMIDDIERLGINSVEGFVRALPQNYAGHTQTSALDGSSSVGTLGVAVANLRGLGSDGTLVLVNGRRTATSPTIQGSNVNLNSIPFSAIERVEVLTDGAAAIYGGDAVAGVLNFILKKGYNTQEKFTFRYTSGGNGGDSMVIDPTFGTNWGSGSMSASLRFESIDPILTADTGFNTLDFTSRGGTDHRAQPGPSHPLSIRDATTSTLLGGVDASRDASVPVTLADISVANLAPYESVPKYLSDKRESTSAFLSIEQNVNDNIDAYFEFNYADYESYAEVGGIFARRVVVPASNAFNDTGIPLRMSYDFKTETENGLIEVSSNQSATESTGAVIGLIAGLPFNNWKLDAFFKVAEEQSWTRAFDGPNPALLAERLADSNPATALNFFGDGTQQSGQALADLFQVSQHVFSAPASNTNQTRQFSMSTNGDMFEVPGGMIAGVIGYDYREDSRTFSGYLASTLLETEPSREVNAVYAEILLPVIGEDISFPGVHSLEMRAAVRWEEYVIKGPFEGADTNVEREFAETSPSIGLAWYLTPTLKFRANFGETFKAPRLDELFRASEMKINFLSFILPSILSRAGVSADPITGARFGMYPINDGGNPDLQPEISDTMTVGFDYVPEGGLQGLILKATYAEIETQDVVAHTARVLSDATSRFVDLSAGRDENGNIVQWNMFPVNFSEETLRAADMSVSYDFNSRWGNVQLGMAGTYTFERSLTFFPGGTPVETQETLGGPDRLKYRLWAALDAQPWAVVLNLNYSSSYENQVSRVQSRIDSYTSLDLTSSYEFRNGWRIDAGIRNLTDAEFPFVDGRQPFDPRRVNIMGRTSYIEVSKSLDLF